LSLAVSGFRETSVNNRQRRIAALNLDPGMEDRELRQGLVSQGFFDCCVLGDTAREVKSRINRMQIGGQPFLNLGLAIVNGSYGMDCVALVIDALRRS
jgi:hypothetical protein